MDQMKVLLVLCDGLRPDCIRDHPAITFLRERGSWCMDARTVFPPVTLPCHMSLFHSVDPGRHGITTNVYVPQVRPVPGLFERLAERGLRCAMYYNWAELRDLARRGSLARSQYISDCVYGSEAATRETFARAMAELRGGEMDFAFLYLGWTDGAGHASGWESPAYLRAVRESCDMVGELVEALSGKYTIFLTSDHGGHDRTHGLDIPEDMTIPIFCLGPDFPAGREMPGLTILDVAPTIARLLGAEIPREWEGQSLC